MFHRKGRSIRHIAWRGLGFYMLLAANGQKTAAPLCLGNAAETLMKTVISARAAGQKTEQHHKSYGFQETCKNRWLQCNSRIRSIVRNLTVKSMLPWRLPGISWPPLETIGIHCISSAQPWGGSMRTTRAIEASAEILRLSGKRRKPLATVTFRRSRDAEDLRRTQMMHRQRAVHQKLAKVTYWNPCRKPL